MLSFSHLSSLDLELDGLPGGTLKNDFLSQINGLIDCSEFVVPVSALTENFEYPINLGKGRDG